MLARIESLLSEKDLVTLAIDGPCASGKTTLAAFLADAFDGQVIHMDDFFLRPHQRTKARLSEVGGNLDRERFSEEVLKPLSEQKNFSYQPYLCSEGRLGYPIAVIPRGLVILEGSYSQHPAFGKPYDLTVFCTVSPALQRERILKRPSHLHKRFFQEWIPMEETYFSQFQIAERSDLVLQERDG
ncbi:MAG: hypothetical protein IKJ74_02175 [Clostridia bacterium]|nr:hypothetical protein [Clostridia bacterium]